MGTEITHIQIHVPILLLVSVKTPGQWEGKSYLSKLGISVMEPPMKSQVVFFKKSIYEGRTHFERISK